MIIRWRRALSWLLPLLLGAALWGLARGSAIVLWNTGYGGACYHSACITTQPYLEVSVNEYHPDPAWPTAPPCPDAPWNHGLCAPTAPSAYPGYIGGSR